MGHPTALRACGVLCCPIEALAPSPLCLGLGAELSAPDIFTGIADNVLSVGAPHLEPHPLGLMSPREVTGLAAPGRP